MEIKASKKEWEILAAAVSTWGKDAQAKMLLEEMAELQKEICEIEEQISQINIFKCIVRNVIKLPEDQTL